MKVAGKYARPELAAVTVQMLDADLPVVQVVLSLGIVLAQAINLGTQHIYPWGWRISLALAGVPAIVLTLGGIFLPETPNSLIERGKVAVSALSTTTIPSTDPSPCIKSNARMA